MIYDLLAACSCGYDILLVYLSLYGLSLAEIAAETGDSKTSVWRRLSRIRARMQ